MSSTTTPRRRGLRMAIAIAALLLSACDAAPSGSAAPVADTAPVAETAPAPTASASPSATAEAPAALVARATGKLHVYDAPDGTVQGSFPNGAQVTAVCRSEGSAVYANQYNTENGRYSYGKHSGWWLRLPDGRFIPYAWVNFPGPENQVWNELQPCYNLAS